MANNSPKKFNKTLTIWKSPAALALSVATIGATGIGAYLNALVASETLATNELTGHLLFWLAGTFDLAKAFVPLAALAAWRAGWKMMVVPLLLLALILTGFSATASMTVIGQATEKEKGETQKIADKKTRLQKSLKTATYNRDESRKGLRLFPAPVQTVAAIDTKLQQHVTETSSNKCQYAKHRKRNPIDCGKFDKLTAALTNTTEIVRRRAVLTTQLTTSTTDIANINKELDVIPATAATNVQGKAISNAMGLIGTKLSDDTGAALFSLMLAAILELIGLFGLIAAQAIVQPQKIVVAKSKKSNRAPETVHEWLIANADSEGRVKATYEQIATMLKMGRSTAWRHGKKLIEAGVVDYKGGVFVIA